MKKKILLVDNDSAVRHVLVRILMDEDYVAVAAGDAEEALQLAPDFKFDLILLDWKLPEQEGWASFETLSVAYPEVPIILMTTRSSRHFPMLAAGASALLEKPLDFNKLISTIYLLLEESTDVRIIKQNAHQSECYYFPAQYALQT